MALRPYGDIIRPEEWMRARVLARQIARVAADDPAVKLMRRELFGSPEATVTRAKAFALLESEAFLRGAPVPAESGTPRLVTLPRREGVATPRRAHPGSQCEFVRSHCAGVATLFHWTEPDAILFVLTGEPPGILPIAEEIQVVEDKEGKPLRVTIVLRVESFLSAKAVQAAYSSVWTRQHSKLTDARLTRRPGPALSERALTLFEFVQASTRETWRAMTRDWNRHAREEWRDDDPRHIERDYKRAANVLLSSDPSGRRERRSRG